MRLIDYVPYLQSKEMQERDSVYDMCRARFIEADTETVAERWLAGMLTSVRLGREHYPPYVRRGKYWFACHEHNGKHRIGFK